MFDIFYVVSYVPPVALIFNTPSVHMVCKDKLK
jgi:hypothetical protein